MRLFCKVPLYLPGGTGIPHVICKTGFEVSVCFTGCFVQGDLLKMLTLQCSPRD